MRIRNLFWGLVIPTLGFAQSYDLPNPDNAPAPCHPIPHERQILWNETEFYAFFHYGMNTFTGLEWGFGNEPESKYARSIASRMPVIRMDGMQTSPNYLLRPAKSTT